MIGVGGYTARRVKIWRRGEGFRVGGRSAGCGPVRIEDSFAKISIPPGCPGDPHSDGIQGVDGPPLTVVNVTIDFREAACGTAPFFVPDQQGNTTATVDGLLVMGGGSTFRLGVPGSVRGLSIVDGSWGCLPRRRQVRAAERLGRAARQDHPRVPGRPLAAPAALPLKFVS